MIQVEKSGFLKDVVNYKHNQGFKSVIKAAYKKEDRETYYLMRCFPDLLGKKAIKEGTSSRNAKTAKTNSNYIYNIDDIYCKC